MLNATNEILKVASYFEDDFIEIKVGYTHKPIIQKKELIG